MGKSQAKTCMMPKCRKEVYETESYFCGEHEREFLEFKKWTIKGTKTILAAAVMFVVKKAGKKILTKK